VRYDKVRWIQPGNHTPQWQPLSYFAARHSLGTDAVYLARVGGKQLGAAQSKAAAAVWTGSYERDSLYFLDPAVVTAALMSLDRKTDLLAKVDGFYILAPGWNACAECGQAGSEVTLGEYLPTIKVGERVDFTQSAGRSLYLGSGWSVPGSLGTWSDGDEAEIVLPFSGAPPARLLVKANPLITPSHPRQAVEIFVNGVQAAKVSLTADYGNHIDVGVPEEARERIVADGYLRLRFVLPDAARPVDLGINADTRRLALHLASITVM
jgi:hypothetical protein